MKLDIGIVNHETAGYLHNLLASIRLRVPPGLLGDVHIWDNASSDRSGELLTRLAAPGLVVHRSARNVGHGPALDRLLRDHFRSSWALLLDPDTEVLDDLSALLPLLAPEAAFVGQVHPQPNQLYAYLCHLAVNRRLYLELPPFQEDGAPGLAFFHAVEERGLPWARFRFRDHIHHFGQGALRAVFRGGRSAHPFFRFAAGEVARDPDAQARLGLEAELALRLEATLAGRAPEPLGDGPWRSLIAPAARPPRRRRELPAPLLSSETLLRRARRLGLREPDRYRGLLGEARRLRPGRVLEIGTAHGATLYLWCRAAAPDAVVVSVDEPAWELDDPGEAAKRAALLDLARGGQRLHLVRGDPCAERTRDAVADLLAGERVDFLFVGADPRLGERNALLSAFGPLVRPGGLIASADGSFHTGRP